jgi:glutathione S-transferase
MKLYTFPPAPNPARVNFIVKEKQSSADSVLDLEIIIINLLKGEQIRSIERSIEMNVFLRIVRAVHATNSPLSLPANPALAENELKRLPVALERVNQMLGNNDFVTGERPSIADCTLLAALNFARLGQLDIDGDYPHLQRWHELYALRHL